jgi:hypothetical protein
VAKITINRTINSFVLIELITFQTGTGELILTLRLFEQVGASTTWDLQKGLFFPKKRSRKQ